MKALKEALVRIHTLVEKKQSHIIFTNEISRRDREILVRNHWLEEITRGWYQVIRPDLLSGDSTAWYANFWDFLSAYLEHHYGTQYCLSAECSIDLHLGSSTIAKQIIAITPKGKGAPLQLPFETSLLTYADPERLPKEQEKIKGLQIMSLAYALCKVSPTYFQMSVQDAEIALKSVRDASEFIRIILEYNFKAAAGRLIGAYKFLGNPKMAADIKRALENVGMHVIETNPFIHQKPFVNDRCSKSPYATRIFAMWDQFRNTIIRHFPQVPGLPKNRASYLTHISEIYEQDAYHSLSIEGYKVSKELIEKVMEAKWDPEKNSADVQQRDALAARGYYEAFLVVKKSVEKIFGGELAGQVVEHDLSHWYQKLFSPSVQAGILFPAELFGYRRHQVYIRGSRHIPPAKEYLLDSMEALFRCLKEEENAAVRAVLGHFIFVYIHPYMDGNGRVGRFLMNAMLASGGYPWTIIQVKNRKRYLESLESASVQGDISPFTQFVALEMKQLTEVE